MLWGDEAHCYLNGTVLTQNCLLNSKLQITKCSQRNFRTYIKGNRLVWFHSRNNHKGVLLDKITPKGLVTGEKYRQMLNIFVIPALQKRQYLGEIIFIQDGSPSQMVLQVQPLLRQTFTTERIVTTFQLHGHLGPLIFHLGLLAMRLSKVQSLSKCYSGPSYVER
ncbi:uncharacterized protein NPIL_115081 [Nephila pilipes]|uniref:Uncharacterized protein n=1 Tax=Nephila pilipes TaxID=299642 RepID=A0A8X6M7F2_NEPPI|nr:uncharacterized protein NPIL_115081 [Nephila pilipes]